MPIYLTNDMQPNHLSCRVQTRKKVVSVSEERKMSAVKGKHLYC